MIGIALQGVPLAGDPARRASRSAGIDLRSSPLAARSRSPAIDLAGSPLGAHPARRRSTSPARRSPAIPLAGDLDGGEGRDPRRARPARSPARTRRRSAQAFAAGAIKPSATVGDIGYYCTPGTPDRRSSCRAGHTPILLKDFVLNGLPPDVTLEDLLGIDPLGDRLRLGGAAAARASRSRTSRTTAAINDYDVAFTLTGDERRLGAGDDQRSRSRTARATSRARASCRRRSERSRIRRCTRATSWSGSSRDIPLNSARDADLRGEDRAELETETATAEITAGALARRSRPTERPRAPGSSRRGRADRVRRHA